ncbi:MAG TPA: hypothetical protein VIP11_05385 [Gemmatimonadaceae bacterium]
MPSLCRTLFTALAAATVANPALAQKRGTWEGQVSTPNGPQPLIVVIDSVTSGWRGSLVSPQTPDSIRLVEVSVVADTLSFGIPYNGTVVYVTGVVAADKFSGSLWAQNNEVGRVDLKRKAAAGEKPLDKKQSS